MDSRAIARELEKVWRAYRAGLLSLNEARQQQSLLRDMLRARELVELEDRLDKVEQAIGIKT